MPYIFALPIGELKLDYFLICPHPFIGYLNHSFSPFGVSLSDLFFDGRSFNLFFGIVFFQIPLILCLLPLMKRDFIVVESGRYPLLRDLCLIFKKKRFFCCLVHQFEILLNIAIKYFAVETLLICIHCVLYLALHLLLLLLFDRLHVL